MELEHISGEEIKRWLADIGEDREWLARQCHVSKPTVNGWLSAGRTIPKPTLSILKSLMGKRISINPALPITTFMKAQDLAEKESKTLDGWIEGLIDKEIQKAESEGFSFTEYPGTHLKTTGSEGNGLVSLTRPPQSLVPPA